MSTTASTDVAVYQAGGFLALNHSTAEMGEMLTVLKENLGGETLSSFDLPRLGIPSGGGISWEIPGADGDVEPSKTLTGIIVYFERTHSYWPHTQASGTPPACSSVGPAFKAAGVGDPGGPCATCPHNVFGTKIRQDGRSAPGKACTERENWFLMVPDRPLPIVVSLSPASLGHAKDYRVKTLGSVGKHYSSVVTSITLANDTNDTGDKYSYIVPKVAGNLSPDEAAKARAYADALRPVFAATVAAVAAEAKADVEGSAEEIA